MQHRLWTALFVVGFAAIGITQGAIFEQTDTTTWNTSDGATITSDDSNPVTVAGDREWVWANSGLGVLSGQTVSWSFDFAADGDGSSVVLGLTSSEFDGGSDSPGDGYFFGFTDVEEPTLALGATDRGGKNKIGQTGTIEIIDSGLTLAADQTASVTVAFDGTDGWTLSVLTDTTDTATGGTFSSVVPVAESTYVDQDLSFLGVYGRYGTTATLGDMTIVPEPATLTLLGLGSLAWLRRRRSA